MIVRSLNKKMRVILIVLTSFLLLYAFLGQFGFLKLYHNPTSANEPGLKINSKMFVTNLITPKRGNFICFERNDEMFGHGVWIHRLVAKETDTILIDNGILYVNGENFDKSIDLMHFYRINKNEFKKLKVDNQITEVTINNLIEKDLYLINLKDKIAIKYGVQNKRDITPKNEVSNEIKKTFKRDWNKDNFGEIIIPKGKFFVLGDNRDNSNDSRYIGLIDENDLVGVVIQN
ncbi:signal peptidase I [Namhaeicola litoreus]|uniref:Signal peptidase I n=1 Tax=Namhaeicola litoreus TaxID=1052145 RepID=A0ABW3Y837_9FLAO